MKISSKSLAALYWSPQFLRFLLVGSVAAGANWLAGIGFSTVMPFMNAVYCAYAVGIVVGFLLNKRFVFSYSDRPLREEVTWFLIINAVAFPVVAGIASLLGDIVLPQFMARAPAHALGHGLAVLAPAALNFALHKFITFRTKADRHSA